MIKLLKKQSVVLATYLFGFCFLTDVLVDVKKKHKAFFNIR